MSSVLPVTTVVGGAEVTSVINTKRDRHGRERHYVSIMVHGERVALGACDARAEAEELEAAGYERAREEPTLMTVSKWGSEWLDRRELDKLRSVKTDRGRWKHVDNSKLGRTPIAMVTFEDVSAWIGTIRRKTISPKTIRECVQLLSKAFDDAIVAKHVTGNPVRIAWKQHRAALGRIQAQRRAVQEPWTYLTADEQRALLTNDSIPEAHRLAMAFAIFVGLRQGEQFNLEIADVHIDADRPWLFVRWGSKGQSPKNGKTRKVSLSPDACAVVRRWLDVLPTWAPENPHGLLFPTKTGCRVAATKTTLFTADWNPKTKKQDKVNLFTRYLEAVGITRRVRWHDLRHTTASALVSGMWGRRWTLEEVQAYMGHDSRQSTERYAHLAAGVVERALEETTFSPRSREECRPKPGKKKAGKPNGSGGLRGKDLNLRPSGYEPHTLSELLREVTPDFFTPFSTKATAVLTAIADGEPNAADLAADFVHELTESDDAIIAARAALVVNALEADDPFWLDRVVDLAERVLDAESEARRAG